MKASLSKFGVYFALAAGLALGCAPHSPAQANSATPQRLTPRIQKQVQKVPYGFLGGMGAQLKFGRMNKAPATRNLANPSIFSVQHFNGSFTALGQQWPFTMVGKAPGSATATIANEIRPIVMVFPDFVDQNGNPIVLDPTPIMPTLVSSPIWQDSQFSTGFTQYGDAIQRASLFQFLRNADKDNDGDVDSLWHTLLRAPHIQPTLVIEVPAANASLFQTPDGTIFALVDPEFWISQLDTIYQLQPNDADRLSIVYARNILLAPNLDPSQCCILGFHTVLQLASANPNVIPLETVISATWLDAGIFIPNVADIHPVSHEIAEWLADPFVSNVVPPWTNAQQGNSCSNLLEVGDMLAGDSIPISLNGFLYHPQTVALLPWFAEQTPSKAFQGAYSYPDTTGLTSAATTCTLGAAPIKP